jgi:hypothetical protein
MSSGPKEGLFLGYENPEYDIGQYSGQAAGEQQEEKDNAEQPWCNPEISAQPAAHPTDDPILPYQFV